jgi:virulence factor Mce-like protein
VIETLARFIVTAVKTGHRQRAWLSGIALVLTLVVGLAYLAIGALRINPFDSTYQVTIRLPESGGLLANQDVSVRGIRVGRIQSLRPTPTGIEVIANINANTKIPAASPVRVSGLSPAGEQYIDFEPASNSGPFLSNGSVIGPQRTTTPIPLSQVLADADGMLAQTDPKKLEIVKRELSLSKEGPQKLTDIIDGSTFLLSTMDPVLPQTVSMLKTSRVVLTTLSDKNAGLAVAARNVGDLMTGVNKDGPRLSQIRRSDAARDVLGGQPVRRQLRHHGRPAGQPGDHRADHLCPGPGLERGLPELSRVHARGPDDHHARARVVGDRRHLPALHL